MAEQLMAASQPTLLVVEDDPAMLVALRDILESSGYSVRTARNGRVALDLLAEEQPSLILSDISMPIMDGYQLFEAVRKQPNGTAIPFIFLTARGTREDIIVGKSLGADDYITKPITSHELLTAVQARLQRTGEIMVAQLKSAYKASLKVLANAIEARDHYTRDHVDRVNAYAQLLAGNMGWDYDARDVLEYGAILHDIGKIAVRETVLRKKGPLDEEELREMRQHPVVGAQMLRGIPYLAPAIPIVLYHQEHWDGSGYPEGIKGLSIPSGARLLALVDTFDAMTSDRPYRPALDSNEAVREITQKSGRQFDPDMVAAFILCWDGGEVQRILNNGSSHHASSV